MKRHTHSTAFPYRTPYDVLDPMGYYKPPYTYRKPRKVWRCVLLHTQRGRGMAEESLIPTLENVFFEAITGISQGEIYI